MAQEQAPLQFEWVNAWVASTHHPVMPRGEPFVVPALVSKGIEQATSEVAEADDAEADHPDEAQPQPAALVFAPKPPLTPDQLMRDIAEIERVRDALASQSIPVYAKHRTEALTLVPSRTTDAVPLVIGGVLAFVMLTVFGAAAAMTKLAR